MRVGRQGVVARWERNPTARAEPLPARRRPDRRRTAGLRQEAPHPEAGRLALKGPDGVPHPSGPCGRR
ncbi:predicted protein [Streptomyces viridosporus ATCC 14672]|uniref:Predicted protein n=1 Tax=Streptomyces viridosporus (strain ATCC 14672 / DSM 40746 / JCM 4963 / KCTC 9882 / NRRL B-12104 / FH 1290) TaxID=566461 RepID=D5ZT96_STRV1|nr:predicted protein [Streptomyces viridosporus ATCC 14672]